MNEQDELAALHARAAKAGCRIELSPDKRGYYLWEVLPGIGRRLLLGREGAVSLDAIAKRLDGLKVADKKG
jgi:hypothetical protein